LSKPWDIYLKQEKMVCGQQDGVLIMYMLLHLFIQDCLELVIHLINNGLVILQINYWEYNKLMEDLDKTLNPIIKINMLKGLQQFQWQLGDF